VDAALLQRANQHAPDSPRVVGNLGVALEFLREPDAALADFEAGCADGHARAFGKTGQS
jgi:hypothetical protein